MLSEFHLVLHELEHDDCPLTPNLLSRMSGPTPSEADGFVLFLERISPERKRDIITRMVEYSEENFEIDYMDIFRRCLNDSDPSVRRQAIEGLWEDDRPGLVKPLLSILSSDKDSAVCASAAASLGRFLFLAECDELDSVTIQCAASSSKPMLTTTPRCARAPCSPWDEALTAFGQRRCWLSSMPTLQRCVTKPPALAGSSSSNAP